LKLVLLAKPYIVRQTTLRDKLWKIIAPKSWPYNAFFLACFGWPLGKLFDNWFDSKREQESKAGKSLTNCYIFFLLFRHINNVEDFSLTDVKSGQ